MFDGNHRVRRGIDLSGSSRRRGRGAGGPPPSSSAPPAPSRRGRTASSYAPPPSSIATSAASGVVDRKSELLESARVRREARRVEKRRNGAAGDVQRLYRGRAGRRAASSAAGRRFEALLALARAAESAASASAAAAAAAGGSGSGGAGAQLYGIARGAASALAARLGPRLRPHLGGGYEEERDALLALGSALAAAGGGGRAAGGAASSTAEGAAREAHVRGTLVRRALRHLRSLRPGGSSGGGGGTEDDDDAAAAAAAAGLVRLVADLVGAPDALSPRPDTDADTDTDAEMSDAGDGGGGGGGSVVVSGDGGSVPAGAAGSDLLLLPSLRGSDRGGGGGGGDETTGLTLLFLCFKDWLWAVSSSSSSMSSPTSEAGWTATVLLRLSCRAASALGADGAAGGGGGDDDGALSVLAAAVLCSPPHLFADITSAGGAGRTASVWGSEFGRCLGGGKFGGGGPSSSGWCGALLPSLAGALPRRGGGHGGGGGGGGGGGSGGGSGSGGAAAATTEAVRGIVSGREVPLLANASSLLDGSDPGGAAAAAAASALVRILELVLARGGALGALASMAAGGEDVRALVAGGGKGGGGGGSGSGAAMEVVDLTNDDDDDESSDTDDDDEDDDETSEPPSSAAERAARPRPPAASSAAAPSFSSAAAASAASAAPPRRYRRSRSNRLSRQDVQTVSKLDRLYQAEIAAARRGAVGALRSRAGGDAEAAALADLAAEIGGGGDGPRDNLVVRLGAVLLDAGAGADEDDSAALTAGGRMGPPPSSSAAAAAATASYASVLSYLLRFCSSSKRHGRSGGGTRPPSLLGRLAFHPTLLDSLWRASRRMIAAGHPAADSTLAAFCDAFAHGLVAVDDEEFLARYARPEGGGAAVGGPGGPSSIIAADVVSSLRCRLYELYWSRPVLASDVSLPSPYGGEGGEDDVADADAAAAASGHRRARLLLSGTRLYNSLHERWCRVRRTAPFCGEEDWWFPRLVTKERDERGAVVGGASGSSYAAGAGGGGGGDDDDDDDSAASPMEVDGVNEDDDDEDGGEAAAPTAAEEQSDALASSFRDPKMARVLTSVPQSVPFDRRVRLFNSLLDADKARTQDEERTFRQVMMRRLRDGFGENDDDVDEWEFSGRERVEIRRDRLYGDSLEQLNGLGRRLRRKVQVTFVNRHGATEAGIDGGGVFKEFLDDLISEAFDPRSGHRRGGGGGGGGRGRTLGDATGSAPLFAESPVRTLQINAAAGTSPETLRHYEFLGRVLGKAVYESILVEPQFCLPFLNQLLGRRNTIDDLKNVDPEFYHHLNALRRMSSREIEGLGLAFEYTVAGGGGGGAGGGGGRTVPLLPDGHNIPVTSDNVIRYVHLVAHRKLNAESASQTRSFLRGFRDLIPASWVRLFSSHELQKLIGGDDAVRGIDVDGLRAVMQYSGGYHPSQEIIRWFWQVLEEMTPRQQRDFLKFVTSCSRQPLLGFGALTPLPCIQQIWLREEDGRLFRRGGGGGAGGGGDGDNVRLPTSSTCMNLLKLPKYGSKEMLREKLLYAIDAGAGFELS